MLALKLLDEFPHQLEYPHRTAVLSAYMSQLLDSERPSQLLSAAEYGAPGAALVLAWLGAP